MHVPDGCMINIFCDFSIDHLNLQKKVFQYFPHNIYLKIIVYGVCKSVANIKIGQFCLHVNRQGKKFNFRISCIPFANSPFLAGLYHIPSLTYAHFSWISEIALHFHIPPFWFSAMSEIEEFKCECIYGWFAQFLFFYLNLWKLGKSCVNAFSLEFPNFGYNEKKTRNLEVPGFQHP